MVVVPLASRAQVLMGRIVSRRSIRPVQVSRMRAGCGHEERAGSAVMKRAMVMPARVVSGPAGVMPAAVPRAGAFGGERQQRQRKNNRGSELWACHRCAHALKVGPAGGPLVQNGVHLNSGLA